MADCPPVSSLERLLGEALGDTERARAAVSGVFTLEGTPTRPKQPPIVPIADNVVGWLGTTGILAALRTACGDGKPAQDLL